MDTNKAFGAEFLETVQPAAYGCVCSDIFSPTQDPYHISVSAAERQDILAQLALDALLG